MRGERGEGRGERGEGRGERGRGERGEGRGRGSLWYRCYVQIPKESGCDRKQKIKGQKHIWLIAIDYHSATGTAGTECKGDQRSKRARWSESGTDSDGLTETQEQGDLAVEQEGQNKQK